MRSVPGWAVACGVLALAATARGQAVLEIKDALLNIVETVNVPATHDGVLRSVQVREGDVVSAGQLLAEIDAELTQLELDEARAQSEISRLKAANDVDIRYAEKSAEVAKAELDRALFANSVVLDSVSASEIDRLQLVVEKSHLEIEQARHNADIARRTAQLDELRTRRQELLMERHSIRAPLAGMIVAQNFRAGEWVRVSDPVARIVRIDRLRVEDFVPVDLAIEGLENRRVTFRPDLERLQNQEFTGRIVFVHPEANPVKSQMRFWAEIDNRDLLLRPGLQGRLTLHRDAIENAR